MLSEAQRGEVGGREGAHEVAVANPHPKGQKKCCFPHDSSEWCMNSLIIGST